MPYNRDKTHCKRGHPFTPEDTYRTTKGYRVCRACVRQLHQEKMHQARAFAAASAPAGPDKPEGIPPVPHDTLPLDSAAEWVRVLESPPGVRLATLDEFLAHFRVNLDIWEVEKHVINRLPVAMRDVSGEPVVVHSTQWKVTLRRRLARDTFADLKTALLADLRTASLPTPPTDRPTDPDTLLVLEPVDAHLGALAWGQETGEADYDLAIAARLYRQAVAALLARAAPHAPAKIVLRIGDDFLHVDSERNTTTGGTPQDVDGRWKKVFRMAVSVAAHAVRGCAALAPVEVVIVPGNHDALSAFTVGECLAALFAEDPRVTVQSSVTPRLYVEWGTVLLCFAHGDKEVPGNLPLLVATERPDAWARTRVREVHLGHLHRRRKMAEDEFNGVRVRWLPSLKATDQWHASKGYTTPHRATEAHLYSARRGYLGTLSEPVAEAA